MSRTRILFICIGNMCRSPMAEAIARHLEGDRILAYSAGLAPTGQIATHVPEALAELGVPSHDLSSKGLSDVPLREMDVIVSLAGPQALQILPRNLGADCEAWSISDPVGEDLETFVAAASIIKNRVRRLLDKVLADPWAL